MTSACGNSQSERAMVYYTSSIYGEKKIIFVLTAFQMVQKLSPQHKMAAVGKKQSTRYLMKSEGRLALCMRAMFVGVYCRAVLCLTFVPDRTVWAQWYFGIRSQQRRDARQRCEKGRDGDAYD